MGLALWRAWFPYILPATGLNWLKAGIPHPNPPAMGTPPSRMPHPIRPSPSANTKSSYVLSSTSQQPAAAQAALKASSSARLSSTPESERKFRTGAAKKHRKEGAEGAEKQEYRTHGHSHSRAV